VADLEEATEQRMHSVGDLVPRSEDIHERARVSESAEEHRRRVERRRADDNDSDA
jgi:hypothetical protein